MLRWLLCRKPLQDSLGRLFCSTGTKPEHNKQFQRLNAAMCEGSTEHGIYVVGVTEVSKKDTEDVHQESKEPRRTPGLTMWEMMTGKAHKK